MLAVLLAGGAVAGDAAPSRIVSINLCTDQLLIHLARPAQILSLSLLARDPELSPVVEAAKAFPMNTGQGEEVLLLRPDLVVSGAFSPPKTRELLARQGLVVHDLMLTTSLAQTKDQIRLFGQRIGRVEAAHALVEQLDAAARLAEGGAGPRLRALYLDRRGIVAGRGTLLHDLMEAAGFDNVAARHGIEGWAMLDIERIMALKPDVLIMHYTGEHPRDQGLALLGHAALEHIVPMQRRVYVPLSASMCPGPGLVQALEALAAGRARLLAARQP